MTIITAQEKRETLMNTVRSLNAMKNGDRRRKYFKLFSQAQITHLATETADVLWTDPITSVKLIEKENTCEVVV